MKAAIIGDPKRSAKYAPDWPIVKETDKVFFDLDAPVEEIVEKAGDADVLLADAIAKATRIEASFDAEYAPSLI